MKKILLLIAIITVVSCDPIYVKPSEEEKGNIQYDTAEYTRETFPDCKP